MQTTLLSQLISQISEEKKIPKEKILEAIEQALSLAFRKDFGRKDQNIKVEFDPKTGESKIFDVKKIVVPSQEEDWRLDQQKEILLEDAIKIKKNVKEGDEIKIEIIPPHAYGRIAAQTAKQAIIQKLREAEKEVIYASLKEREGQIIIGVVQRIDKKNVFVDLGETLGVLLFSEQSPQEKYLPGKRLKFLLKEVKKGKKGSEVFLSRKDPLFVERLFEIEVPEIETKAIEIKVISREAGSRTKIAVKTLDEKIDPIGSCVGQKGTRIQTVINELGGEKIDIIMFSENPEEFIKNALSPAKVVDVSLNEKEKKAKVEVKKDQYSLAIGREGQNVRLASKLTGWTIDIKEIEEKSNG